MTGPGELSSDQERTIEHLIVEGDAVVTLRRSGSAEVICATDRSFRVFRDGSWAEPAPSGWLTFHTADEAIGRER